MFVAWSRVYSLFRFTLKNYLRRKFESSAKQFLPLREGARALARFNALITLRGEAA
jgi:hypothetical protein